MKSAADKFGYFLSLGLLSMITLKAVINIGTRGELTANARLTPQYQSAWVSFGLGYLYFWWGVKLSQRLFRPPLN